MLRCLMHIIQYFFQNKYPTVTFEFYEHMHLNKSSVYTILCDFVDILENKNHRDIASNVEIKL